MQIEEIPLAKAAIDQINEQVIERLIELVVKEKSPEHFESQGHYRARLTQQLQNGLDLFLKRLQSASKLLNREGICLGSSAQAEELSDVTYLGAHYQEGVEEGRTPQQLLGITDHLLLKAYEVGFHLFERHAYHEAADLFLLLTQLNPKIHLFWSALAACEEKQEHWQEASWAWAYAAELDEQSLESYFAAARCFRQLHQWEQARSALQRVLSRSEGSAHFASQRARAQKLLTHLITRGSHG